MHKTISRWQVRIASGQQQGTTHQLHMPQVDTLKVLLRNVLQRPPKLNKIISKLWGNHCDTCPSPARPLSCWQMPKLICQNSSCLIALLLRAIRCDTSTSSVHPPQSHREVPAKRMLQYYRTSKCRATQVSCQTSPPQLRPLVDWVVPLARTASNQSWDNNVITHCASCANGALC